MSINIGPAQEPGGDWSHAQLGPVQDLLEKAIESGEYTPLDYGIPMTAEASEVVWRTFCTSQGFLDPESTPRRDKVNIWG